jgi:septal ring factor EnvC (AmiA/AmiB activator)
VLQLRLFLCPGPPRPLLQLESRYKAQEDKLVKAQEALVEKERQLLDGKVASSQLSSTVASLTASVASMEIERNGLQLQLAQATAQVADQINVIAALTQEIEVYTFGGVFSCEHIRFSVSCGFLY